MIRRSLPLWLACLALLLPAAVRCEPPVTANVATCRRISEEVLAKEQRLYRSILFGLKKTEETPANEIRFDQDGHPWIKADEDTWETVTEGYEGVTWSDLQMDQQGEIPHRKGIFETRYVSTTDLVPYLTQAYRTFKCRTNQACKAVEMSLTREETDPQDITVVIPGCTEEQMKTFVGCHLKAGGSNTTEQGDLLTYCSSVQKDLIARERDLLALSTEYDAAYRSLLQFSGEFDAFLQEFRWPLANSMRKAVQLVGSLHRIPCFIGSCDEGPPPQP